MGEMDTRLTILGNRPSLISQILYQLRDETVQKDRLRFRHNMERLGELMAYEISRHLPYEQRTVTTPLGQLEMSLLKEQPVLVSVLRAGLPFHQGFLRMFEDADNGFIAAYRHTTKGNDFVIRVEYSAHPELEGRTIILLDPMIATGRSLVMSYKEIAQGVNPENVFVAGVVASDEGLSYVQRNLPQARIFVGAVDNELTAKSYIVPGLGDAGDLSFGPK